MKPALVLGLALAANAMTADQGDNELIIAPTGKFDRDLAQRFPGKIMYDEVADDELYKGFPPRENFNTYEEWLRATRRYDADDEFLVRPLAPHIAADDEELFVAPQGKLAELAKKYPGMIMFNEQADDELGLKIVHLPGAPAEHVAYDDEFAVMTLPRSRFNSDEEYQKYLVRMSRSWDDAADDEFIVMLKRREFFKSDEEYLKYLAHTRAHPSFDDAADDELALKIVHLPVAETVAYDDDELLVVDKDLLPREGTRHFIPYFDKETRTWKIGPAQLASFDDDENYVYHKSKKPIIDQADDELAVKLPVIPPGQRFEAKFEGPWGALMKERFEKYGRTVSWAAKEVDDELAVKIVNLPTGENGNIAFDDDELAFIARAPRVVVDKSLLKPAKNQTSEALVRDDEADDELAYLGHLLNERAQPRSFDEYKKRAEKPSHVKAEERAQMKSELPKMQRKLRPSPDVIPMAQN